MCRPKKWPVAFSHRQNANDVMTIELMTCHILERYPNTWKKNIKKKLLDGIKTSYFNFQNNFFPELAMVQAAD